MSFFWAISLLSLNTRYRAAQVMSVPWPRSPNITANRKGKVMMVYGAGDEELGRQAAHEGRVAWQVKQHMSEYTCHNTQHVPTRR